MSGPDPARSDGLGSHFVDTAGWSSISRIPASRRVDVRDARERTALAPNTEEHRH